MTAVEWLIDEIEKHYIINNGSLDPIIVMELKRQAKEMEKEQLSNAWWYTGDEDGPIHDFEDYYQETYN